MKIATLQFAPTLGATQSNINRANTLLSDLKPGQIDLLVLPELAFTGYNFSNLSSIKPFLEPTAAGPTTKWALYAALRLNCHIIVGYPEICTNTDGSTTNYNSTVTVSPQGEVLLNYRKSFLYYTDETWASEGPAGSSKLSSHDSLHSPFFAGELPGLGKIGHGICMDINPYQFTSPWTDYEFATHMLASSVPLVILSTAWLTRLLPEELEIEPEQPDMETVAYWVERFYPFLATATSRTRDEGIVVVFANRCGTEGNSTGSTEIENGMEIEEGDRVCYAGSSCVMKFQGGRVRMFERGEGVAILGKGEEGVLVVDTGQPAKFSLTAQPA